MCDYNIVFGRLRMTIGVQSRAEYQFTVNDARIIDGTVPLSNGGIVPLIGRIVHTFISIVGVIPEHMNLIRMIFMGGSFAFAALVLPHHKDMEIAGIYFVAGILAYMSLLFSVLRRDGLRHWLIRRWGEGKAYRFYEGIVAFVFFHNGASIGFMSESTVGTGFWGDLPQWLVWGIAGSLFLFGLIVKVWSAMLVSVPVYYWKDIFLGRPVSTFASAGPYKVFTNPIYGVGHLTAYAVAIYNNSLHGIFFSAINQACVFLFYFIIEKPFVKRVYLESDTNDGGQL